MHKVILRRAAYTYESLRPLLFEIMDSIGGKEIQQKSRVLIKPNLLAPASAGSALLTHPLVLRGAVEYVLERGAKPQVSDSPAKGSFQKVMKASGIKDALEGLDVECKEFQNSINVNIGEPFNEVEIAEDAMNADVVINLPKLKTHSQMLLTLGVKNMFGCVVGLRKPRWHFMTGVDRELFATLLVRICAAVKPAITIIDGILAMEGQGPGKGGTPRHVGVLVGSSDPVAADIAVCIMLGLDPYEVLTNQAARKIGMAEGRVEIEGESIRIAEFRLPHITPLVFGPQWAHGFLRRHLIQRPVPDDFLCKSCGECWSYCPVEAISHDTGKLIFDYDKCIRCFCCIEVCPHGALKSEESLAGKVFNKIIKTAS